MPRDSQRRLVNVAEGVWYDPLVEPIDYGREYFDKYVGYAATPLGEALTDFRTALVNKHAPGLEAIDLGIGSGQFVEALGSHCCGFDVNPVALHWLRSRGRYRNPYGGPFPVLTCWDSLEHLPHPMLVLRNVRHFVFVSLPIFEDESHVYRSKHFRPDEHYWYFTKDGFVTFMQRHGFGLLDWNRRESELGREDIDSFVFERQE